MSGGNGSKTHDIILQVNTTTIPAPTNPPGDIDSYCSFKGQTNGVTNENFEISVKNGDKVTWSGIPDPANAADVVKITKIDYEEGTNLFGNEDLTPKKDESTITGTISNGKKAQVETYKIEFQVYNNNVLRSSGSSAVYQIDPKIRMKT
jgi:hypothetical protein